MQLCNDNQEFYSSTIACLNGQNANACRASVKFNLAEWTGKLVVWVFQLKALRLKQKLTTGDDCSFLIQVPQTVLKLCMQNSEGTSVPPQIHTTPNHDTLCAETTQTLPQNGNVFSRKYTTQGGFAINHGDRTLSKHLRIAQLIMQR